MDCIHEYHGGFFVWTKSGRAPRYRHETRASAIVEAERLAKENPGRKFIVQQFLEKVSVVEGVAEKEPAMETQNNQNQSATGQSSQSSTQSQNTIWAGVKDNNIGFAHNATTLETQGYNNALSFDVNGSIDGVSFLDASESSQTSQG
jgi:hypothetical protein